MVTIGKFTVFSFDEFSTWLKSFSINRVIKVIQNHHTLSPAYKDFNGNNHIQLLQGMERFHIEERGFAEIAQNITSFPDGKIAICRDLNKIPAGIKGANKFGICIENLGNFDLGKDTMTQQHKDVIPKLNALLCRKSALAVTTDSIVYHHWYDLDTGMRTNGTGNTKSCPGTNFFGGNTVQSCEDNFIPLVTTATSGLVDLAAPVITDSSIQHGTVNAVNGLNVRADNSLSATIITVLSNGTPVNILEEKTGWYRINNINQWVKSDFVKLN